jgi:hypothetical protein
MKAVPLIIRRMDIATVAGVMIPRAILYPVSIRK